MDEHHIDPYLAGHCRAVLDGDRSAIQPMIARLRALDLISASWDAPPDKLDRADLLALVLASMPSRTGFELACRYAEHVLPVWENRFSRNFVPRGAVSTRRDWLDNQLSDADLVDASRRLIAFSRDEIPPLFASDAAACYAAIACTQAFGIALDGPETKRFIFSPSSLGNDIAGLTAQVARMAAGQKGLAAELKWQISQVYEFLY